MKFDPLAYRYPSRRSVIYGRKGMVCTSQPLAAQAGLDIMKAGGNAIDAAIATAACMTVLEPMSNALGSDAFALVWVKDKLYGINGSGRAPMSIDAAQVKALGHETMPLKGWIPVMVPGAPSAWAKLSKRFGKLPLAQVLEPAAQYAEEGYPVSPVISRMWEDEFMTYGQKLTDPCFEAWHQVFAPDGHVPKAGEVWKCQDMANTLREIGATEAESYYRGALADQIDAFSRKTGGWLRKEDLAAYEADWVEPIHAHYHGYDVWEIPPNGSGICALMALEILDGFEFKERDCVDTVHKQLEAMKLAYADARHYVTEPCDMSVTAEELLNTDYAAKRRALITEEAQDPRFGDPKGSGTIYLCTADGEGNMVSMIQSNYQGFGSGVTIPGTGINLQNRGANFSLDPEAANLLKGGKKSYHTIIPSFLTKDGKAVGPFGVMGGFMQPQGHVQVVMNTVDFHMNPQDALNAPRWQWNGGKNILLEKEFPEDIAQALDRKGHEIGYTLKPDTFGRGQIIWRDENGVLCGGTEPRGDGAVAAW